MIEIQINKDVGSFQPKLVGPFTARQTISMIVAAPFCWGAYQLASPALPKDAVGFLCLIPAFIGFLFGWVKPFGIPMERFLKTAFISMVLSPTHRKYITVNTIGAEMPVKQEKHKSPEVKKTAYKPSPEAVR